MQESNLIWTPEREERDRLVRNRRAQTYRELCQLEAMAERLDELDPTERGFYLWDIPARPERTLGLIERFVIGCTNFDDRTLDFDLPLTIWWEERGFRIGIAPRSVPILFHFIGSDDDLRAPALIDPGATHWPANIGEHGFNAGGEWALSVRVSNN
ncbi:MAG TPA: hypothetical protein VMU11_01820 [Verrucomicrobiae bacterium]|nr:hypothetical protein [Verrucomicrobiae bacterium]